MDEHLSEKLSAVSDGEAVYDEAMAKLMTSNSEYQRQWVSSHLVRDVLHGYKVSHDVHSLYLKVASALEHEPTVLAPKKRIASRQFFKQASGFAIAATIAVTAVLTVQQNSPAPQNQSQTVASIPNINNQSPADNLQTVNALKEKPRVSTAVERKLSSYIVNHNEYSASSNMQGMLPYVRIVGFVPTRQVDNEK